MNFSHFTNNIFNNSTNEKVVEIIANRILTGSINPKTHSPFLLEDIVNEKYREAVEDYIILNSGAI
ncbi:hypothetical protein [Clostridium botulinum]|uniref:Uncharacterized protein n=1 Tax=Clostridium botulinum TaxID=1491 RepID=A0A9Q1UZF1_CLOBO|nr:hypothetical protein [Clostridium botulinum]AEB75523.1 hypothetical protein CbC4_0843 [Clostridium botulinum BKT015925]KEH99605.1 hypothetical protein Z953_11490 [Clostridium botulinum D str. 16868]KEI03537.1 hypothetical protein Y848_04670 [Clostridium botulinum C/D str. Sp77]KLU74849.1 hypothetical protein CBC3_11850 [Clostridium botulinum V891]KOA73781.1 hypothetical protein ADU77_13475 [Clostridium botulinum]